MFTELLKTKAGPHQHGLREVLARQCLRRPAMANRQMQLGLPQSFRSGLTGRGFDGI